MKTKNLVLSGIFTAVLCIFSVVTIPIGTVPVTLSMFGVVLVAIVLGAGNAVCSVVAYIFLGAIGLPVFSGFQSGVMVLFEPTGGYIWSYIFVALIIGFSAQYSYRRLAAASAVSLVVLYTLGTIQFSLVQSTSFVSSLLVCVVPFVVFDIIKFVLAIMLGKSIKKRLSF